MTQTERLTLERDEAMKWVVLYGQAFERLRAAVAEFESTHEAILFSLDVSEAKARNTPATPTEEKEH